ncbi:NUDIX hydrolase [Indiicoccus explosivorum]|uniref:NUDIX hydrolase n=1 Tax=Indiicoccus explosivorum TaxID=1917864 RepID=UPI000B431A68|nr:NUDIX domain-containing protein [Indiicoccus explosivorum]
MRPRANTLGLLEKDGKFLVEEQNGKHSKGDGSFYRPIGGTIELGEYSQETLKREFQEEIGAGVLIDRYLACIENVYSIGELIGHEITQLYAVRFEDDRFYRQEMFRVMEPGYKTVAKWVAKEELLAEETVLYPDGLAELIEREF